MKVLQVAYMSEIAGGEKVLFQLATALRDAGHAVVVLSPSPGPVTEHARALGLPSRILPMAKTYDLHAAWSLKRLVLDEGIDLVHTHGMLVNIIGRVACRLAKRAASVSTVHLTRGLGGRLLLPGALAWLKAKCYYRPLDNWTARWNDRVVAVSAAVRDDLVCQGYPGALIEVIPNGIDPSPFDAVSAEDVSEARHRLGVPADGYVLGMVARLSPQKDVSTFLRAFGLLRERFPQLRAFVAGSGPQEMSLRREAKEANVSDRLQFLGHRNDVPVLLRACDLFVLSSRWEGLPLSVLEAMAARKPVAATCVPGTAEAVVAGETGLLVPIGDADALAKAIATFVEAPDMGVRFGSAGRHRVETHFRLDRVAGRHLDLYETVLRERRGP